jgi:hypothetical protein
MHGVRSLGGARRAAKDVLGRVCSNTVRLKVSLT